MMKEALIVVCGPTASGKSSLALRLAEALNGEIVSMDSVQIYRGFDIGSAKPSRSEMARVKHHLVDIKNPNETFDAGEFCERAESAVADIRARKKVPIVVGGTTMYLTTFLHGLADLPRGIGVRSQFEGRETSSLYRELELQDPEEAARLHPNDRLRITRALETILQTGSPVSVLRRAHGFRSVRHAARVVTLWRKRDALYHRIDNRSEAMVRAGLLEETRRLVQQWGRDCSPLRTLGYAQALAVIEERLPPDNFAHEVALHTRRYAKRQMTYLRNEPAKRGWARIAVQGVELQEIEGEQCNRLTFDDLCSCLRESSVDKIEYLPFDASGVD